MPRVSNTLKILSILLISWNLFDALLHVAVNMAEPLRITGNIIGIFAGILIIVRIPKMYAQVTLIASAFAVAVLNTVHASLHGFGFPMLVFIGISIFLLLRIVQVIDKETSPSRLYHSWFVSFVVSLIPVALVFASGILFFVDIVGQTFDGRLKNADYWSEEPQILSAGMGFEGIVGISEVSEEEVRKVGGSWYGSLVCTNGEDPGDLVRTSAPTSRSINAGGKGSGEGLDGLPVVFSWPVATETVDATDFEFTLNTGEKLFADVVTMVPNWELNERNVVVFFADFGNRIGSDEDGARFPVKLEIVEDDTPLLLIGPGGVEFNAIGLTWETNSSPYDLGPSLVGAKLNTVEKDKVTGEGGSQALEGTTNAFPNTELSLYDEGDFKIRVLTTGGFSPDGVTGVRPNMYEDFFRIHALNENGETVLLESIGEEYQVAGGTLRVVGLSDLGQKENPDEGIYYDDCYNEDRDNYIDIILVGDEEAARNITFVEIPSLEGGYSAFYNPGGPGPEPFEGVTYTAPGPPDLEPVIIDLENKMRVTRSVD